jgi:peptidoglycan/xylan/chitin deacetylase (PgdA/CDA1 family)
LKLRVAATIATVLVLIVGFAMISPLFFRQDRLQPNQTIMLSFSVYDSVDAVDWCKNLSAILTTYNIPATVFIVGKVAEQNPQTVTCFSDKVDIGSLTYDNSNLTNIFDYQVKLQEVQQGKDAVDNAGHIDSKVFQAPYGATDPDIYSLLSRSGILADFSYKNQYNVYQNGLFIKYNATVLDGNNCSYNFLKRPHTAEPIIIQFDNSSPTSSIQSFLSKTSWDGFDFVNSSQLTDLALTNTRS